MKENKEKKENEGRLDHEEKISRGNKKKEKIQDQRTHHDTLKFHLES